LGHVQIDSVRDKAGNKESADMLVLRLSPALLQIAQLGPKQHSPERAFAVEIGKTDEA
jgi:hypothetical protein